MNTTMQRIQGLSPKNELELYLVLNNLKPTAEIALSPLFMEDNIDVYPDNTPNKFKIITDSDLYISKKETISFIYTLQTHSIKYSPNCTERKVIENHLGTSTHVFQDHYFISLNNELLNNLKQTWYSRTKSGIHHHQKIGLALGYPGQASKYYNEIFEGNKITPRYLNRELKKAAESNITLPTWLGYISHVPVQIDTINGVYAEESEVQGRKYESFVRKNNASLAQRVDEAFQADIAEIKYKLNKK